MLKLEALELLKHPLVSAVGAFSPCHLWFDGLASAFYTDTDLFLVLICQYLLPPVCLEGKKHNMKPESPFI